MKKYKLITPIILAFTLLCLIGTSIYAFTIEYKPKEKITELSNKFDYKKAYSLVDFYYVEYNPFNRGEEVEIINEDDNFYYVEYNNLTLAINKAFIRKNSEIPFEGFTGYTRANTKVYSDFELNNVIDTLSLNNTIKIIDKVNDVYLIEYNGQIAYIYENNVSKSKISTYVAPKPQEVTPEQNNSSNDDYSSGGSSGGNDSGGGSSDPAPSQGDGEDIELSNVNNQYQIVLLNSTNKETGSILVDGTKSYIAILRRDDEVKVIKRDGDNYKVSFAGISVDVPCKYIRLASEEYPEEYTLYARSNAGVYEDYTLNNKIKSLKVNTIVKVVDEIDDYYIILLEDGTYGYIYKENTSLDEIKIYVAPKPQEVVPEQNNSNNDNYSSGGNDSGGGGSDPAPSEPEPEWTDPVL